jgi:hypothetical protein
MFNWSNHRIDPTTLKSQLWFDGSIFLKKIVWHMQREIATDYTRKRGDHYHIQKFVEYLSEQFKSINRKNAVEEENYGTQTRPSPDSSSRACLHR